MGKKSIFFIVFVLLISLAIPVFAAGSSQEKNAKADAGAVKDTSLVQIDQGLQLISKDEQNALEKRLGKLNETYDVHIGIRFMKRLPDGKSAEIVAKSIAEGSSFSSGANGSMVLLVAMESRDYYVATGRYMNRIITSKEGIPYICDEIVPLLKDGDYPGAAKAFIDAAEEELAYYQQEGEPYDPAKAFNVLAALMAVLASGLIVIGVRAYLISQMSNVHRASDADVYLEKNSFELTEEVDTFLYTNVTAVPKSKGNSSSSDSYSSSSDSGSSGGGGGKF